MYLNLYLYVICICNYICVYIYTHSLFSSPLPLLSSHLILPYLSSHPTSSSLPPIPSSPPPLLSSPLHLVYPLIFTFTFTIYHTNLFLLSFPSRCIFLSFLFYSDIYLFLSFFLFCFLLFQHIVTLL